MINISGKELLSILKKLENQWGWNYLSQDSWGDPYLDSKKIIKFIEEELEGKAYTKTRRKKNEDKLK